MNTVANEGKSKILGTLIYERLIHRGEEIVIVDSDDRAVSAAALLNRARFTATILTNNGVRAGDRVVICVVDNVDTLAISVACWFLSATATVIDFRTSASHRSIITSLVNARLVIESRHIAGSDNYPYLVWDEQWRKAPLTKLDFPSQNDLDRVPAFLSLSSGTTGFPKAYVQTHRQIADRICMRQLLEGTEEGSFFTPMTLAFSATRLMVLNYLAFEDRVIFGKPLFSAKELIDKIQTISPSACAFPPPVIRSLLKEVGAVGSPIFPNLKVLRSIGGPASNEDKLSAYKNLSHGYRMSYSSGLTGTATFLSGNDVLEKTSTSGKPLNGITIEIVDPNTMEKMPSGEIGLIKVYSPYLAAEVIHHKLDTSGTEVLEIDYAFPGDLGFLDADGFLTVTARQSDVIVRGGVNVAPQELENELRSHSIVNDVAVVGIQDDDVGEEIAAFIVTDNASEQDIHELCMRAFSFDRRPRIIKIVDRLPYNLNGKIERKKLRDFL